MEKLLDIKQLSELIQVSRSTIYKWVHIGFVPHFKLGAFVRFRESDIEKWLQKRHKKGRITFKIQVDDV